MVPTELADGYGAGVLSLIVGSSILIDFTGSDYRPNVVSPIRETAKAGEKRPIQ
jgi:hypothetical protein